MIIHIGPIVGFVMLIVFWVLGSMVLNDFTFLFVCSNEHTAENIVTAKVIRTFLIAIWSVLFWGTYAGIFTWQLA